MNSSSESMAEGVGEPCSVGGVLSASPGFVLRALVAYVASGAVSAFLFLV
jgi:hypothetical protein